MYIYIKTCIIHICLYIYIYIYLYIHIYIYIYTYIYTNTHTHIYTHTYTYTHARIRAHTHAYIHTHILSQSELALLFHKFEKNGEFNYFRFARDLDLVEGQIFQGDVSKQRPHWPASVHYSNSF